MKLKLGDVIGWNWSGTHGPILATVKEDLGGGCYGLSFGEENPATPIPVIDPATGQPILDWKLVTWALRWASDGDWFQTQTRGGGFEWSGERSTSYRFKSKADASACRDQHWGIPGKPIVRVVRLLRRIK